MALLSAFLKGQRYKAVSPYVCGDVLDLGCGLAEIVAWLKPGQRYIGIEGRANIMRWLEEHRPGYEFHQRDLDKDALALDQQFDTILMIAVIEHLNHPDNILSQISRRLKPGGKFLITTPSPWGNIIHKIGATLGVFSMEAAQAHQTIFTRGDLRVHLQRNGLRIIHYRRFLLGGNQLCVCQSLADPKVF